MKESTKANLIVFFIIATIAFCISTSLTNFTVNEKHDSYKLISIENDSFKPNYVDEVPTIIETKNTTNATNSTNKTTNTYDNITNRSTDNSNYSYSYTSNEYWRYQ